MRNLRLAFAAVLIFSGQLGAAALHWGILQSMQSQAQALHDKIAALTPAVNDTFTVSPTFTLSPTITLTGTQTATRTASPTATPSATASATATPSATPTDSPSATPSVTPTATDSPTFTITATDSPTSTASPTATGTPSDSPTSTASPTPTVTATDSPTPTASPTPTGTSTNSPTKTASPTPTVTATDSPTRTATPTSTPTATATASPTVTPTPTPTTLAIWDNGSVKVWFDTAGVWTSSTPPVSFEDIAYDHNGVLYGGDAQTGNGQIWAYSGGTWTSFWSSASYQYMYGLTADSSGNLWAVADVNGTVCDLLKINITTKAVTVVVSHTTYIYGLSANGNNVWGAFSNGTASDGATQYQGGAGFLGAPAIFTLAMNGSSTGLWSDASANVYHLSGGSAGGTWTGPAYMCADAAGNIYVADGGAGKVGVYNGSWTYITHSGMVAPYAVAVN